MKDIIALWLIRLARKLTTWGFTDDDLGRAEKQQEYWIEEKKKGKD